jgi:hypothetical protein
MADAKNYSYKPSVDSARVALGDVKVETRPHPAGKKGADISLNEVAKRIREGRNDPHVKGWAGKVLVAAGKPKGNIEQSQALLDALRKQTMYVPDPVGTELNVAARHTLCLTDKLCMPAGDCDDVSVALGAAIMSVGIPVQVVGQSFNGKTDAPTHVLIAIDTTEGWKHIDPSSSTMNVGETFPATKEWWIDPMEINGFALSGAEGSGDFVGVGEPGDFVGVGGVVGVGDGSYYDAVIAQLQFATFQLQTSVNNLGASLVKVQQTRAALQPTQVYDPEPTGTAITDVSTFPQNGIWTESMQAVATQLWLVGNTLVQACNDALNGVRTIAVAENTAEIYIGSLPTDQWSLGSVIVAEVDSVYAFFNTAGQIISGFSAKTGASLTPAQVQTQAAALGATGATGPAGSTSGGTAQTGVTGPAGDIGTGAVPVVAIVAIAAAVSIVAISACYLLPKYLDECTHAADEATNRAAISCIAAGTCPPTLLTTISKNRVAEANAQAANNAADPFARTAASVSSIVMWAVIGGVSFAGIYAAMPLLKELGEGSAASRRAKRLGA